MSTTGGNTVIDIGNTRIKAARFEGDRMVRIRVLPRNAAAIKRFLASLSPGDRVMISDVANRYRALSGMLKKNKVQVTRLTSRTRLPVRIAYRTPRTLGHDRVASAAGASKLFPGKHVLVVDAGTCLKIDHLSARGVFNGGSIAPGMAMRFRALHDGTANLPLLKPIPGPPLTGTDTRESIRAGVQTGMAYEIQGAVDAYRKRFKSMHVLLTGGDWIYFANQLKNPIFVAPELTLLGLNHILNFQHSGDP